MKKSVFGLILLCLLLQTCREDEHPSKGNVQFVFHVSASDNSGGRTSSELPDGSVLLISILNDNGSVMSMEEFAILKFGDQYISEPIPLAEGNDYQVFDFFIRSGNEIVYATPTEDSPLAPLVEDPLPVAFSVTENEVTNLNIEVVGTDAHQPRDFGYVAFGIKVVPGELFKLALFKPFGGETPEFTGAQAYVLLEDDTIFDKYLDPKINSIFFESNPDDYYTLVLIEPSLKKYSRTFRINDLRDELDGNPLTITMDPALTLSVIAPNWSGIGNFFEFDVNTNNPTVKGDLQIDWGDGTLEDITLPRAIGSTLNHIYPNEGPHFVSVSGDLEAIEIFYNAYMPIKEISVRYLSELKEIIIVTSPTKTIDISHNLKLNFLNLSMSNFLSLDVSNNIALKTMYLDFNPDFPTTVIDKIIHDKLQHAIAHNIHNGHLGLQRNFEEPELFVGPPSPAAMDELRILRDQYDWVVTPENF